jgi:peptidoglycan-N-acetylglucosamine deacetylase
MSRISLSVASIAFFMLGSLALRAEEPKGAKPCPEGALGTARTLVLNTRSGLALGFKTYPQSLDLADHEVVLTFDDGPWPSTTPAVLDALAQQCVKATFFLIGRNAQAAPGLTRRELAEGHTLGHHTFSHPAATMRGLNDAMAREDINKGFEADDKAAYGKAEADPKVPFFRFPGFADTPELVAWLESRNITIFGTDLWALDWQPMTPQEELAYVLGKLEIEKRGILLLHDTRRTTVAMLPLLLTELKKRGFRIVHIVPGKTESTDAPPPLRKAPQGWTSQTEAIIRRLRPHLASPSAHGPRTHGPRDFTQSGEPVEHR